MTNKQKQCLLKYLGYYGGNIDGIFGRKSTQATEAFQKSYGLDATGVFDEKTGEMAKKAVAGLAEPVPPADPVDIWAEVKYFKREEFRCKCGGEYCDGFPAEMDPLLLILADRVREHFGAQAIVSSGMRCPIHNRNVGGAADSRHMRGKAMDFRILGQGSTAVLNFVKEQPEVRYTYAIDDSFVHMDVL